MIILPLIVYFISIACHLLSPPQSFPTTYLYQKTQYQIFYPLQRQSKLEPKCLQSTISKTKHNQALQPKTSPTLNIKPLQKSINQTKSTTNNHHCQGLYPYL